MSAEERAALVSWVLTDSVSSDCVASVIGVRGLEGPASACGGEERGARGLGKGNTAKSGLLPRSHKL